MNKTDLGPLADTLADIDVLELILWIGGLVALITFVSKIYKAIQPKVKALNQFLDDWQGEAGRPDVGIPPRKGVMERLKDHGEAIEKITAQVTPNHGSEKSLAVELQDGMAELSGRVENIERHLGLIHD